MSISENDSLAVSGNSIHLAHIIGYFEKQIEKNGEVEKYLVDAPNYYAWLHIASEHMFYRIKELFYVNTEDHKAFDLPYMTLLTQLLNDYSLTKEQIEAVLLFAKIRHLLVHKGFPHPHISPTQNSRKIATGYPFSAEMVSDLANVLKKPSCYPDLQKKYDLALHCIESVENEFVHDFGFVQISKRKHKLDN